MEKMDMLSVDDGEFPLVRSKSDTNFMKRLNNSRTGNHEMLPKPAEEKFRVRSGTSPSSLRPVNNCPATHTLISQTIAVTSHLGFHLRVQPQLGAVEAPHSDSEDVNLDYIGSTSSIGLGIRSLPSTPMSPLQGHAETNHLNTSTSSTASGVNLNSLSRSPSHCSTKSDSKSVKSASPPNTGNSNRSVSPNLGGRKNDSSAEKDSKDSKDGKDGKDKDKEKEKDKDKEKKRKEMSSGRQKKFHRHFHQVSLEERVINYYSCALVGDILLQGHLYITDKHFAFYSNVFGYITKLLIPTTRVVKISKEKTVKLFPNAVGVTTDEERHMFVSFMSREAAFRLMMSVWRPTEVPVDIVKLPEAEKSEYSVEDDSSCSVSGNESPPQPIMATSTPEPIIKLQINPVSSVDSGRIILEDSNSHTVLPRGITTTTATTTTNPLMSSPPPTFVSNSRKFNIKFPTDVHIVYLGVILAVVLALFSGFLLYRIQDIQARTSYSSLDFKMSGNANDEDVYAEVLKWQREMQLKSADEAQNILNANLVQIARVRKSLETLSVLIHDKNSPFLQNDGHYGSSSADDAAGGGS